MRYLVILLFLSGCYVNRSSKQMDIITSVCKDKGGTIVIWFQSGNGTGDYAHCKDGTKIFPRSYKGYNK